MINKISQKNRPIVLVIAILLVLLLAAPGCTREKNHEEQPPGNEEPQTPTPGGKPGGEDPPPPSGDTEERVLNITEMRSLKLEPTVHNVSFSSDGRYITYYVASQVEQVCLIDSFGTEYPLPTPEEILPSREGAVWREDKLYYLSRYGGWDDEPMGAAFYVYSTKTHRADEHPLSLPDTFYPQCFYVTDDEDLLLVGDKGSYKYSLSTKELERLAEFSLSWDIFPWAVWHPNEPLLTYPEGDQLIVTDVLTGKSTVLYQGKGEIEEICWNDMGDTLAVLVGNRVDTISANGEYRGSYPGEGAYSLKWVPQSIAFSYLTRADWSSSPKLVIEDLWRELRLSHRGCAGYAWSWPDKLWTFWESSEQDATILALNHIHWSTDTTQVNIPYFDEATGAENPKLPVTHGQGDWETIAEDLFIMLMETLKSESTPEYMRITDYTLDKIKFFVEEPWGFRVYAYYSVQSQGDYYEAGNGDIGEDGWVNNKMAFIDIYKDQGYYIMGRDWSTSP